mgnify:CR=1 FL=1
MKSRIWIAKMPEYTTYPITNAERSWVLDVVRNWGADFIVTRGRKVYPAGLDGFYAATPSGDRIGLITCEMVGNQCEIITLDAFKKFCGVGTALLESVRRKAVDMKCMRLWLITTNDNLEAMRFYQRRGFTIAALHSGSILKSREIKPSIPEIGLHGIPLRDEIEFEMYI